MTSPRLAAAAASTRTEAEARANAIDGGIAAQGSQPKKYRCWVEGRKEETLRHVDADSSFAARLRMAASFGVKTFNVVAQRVVAA